MTSQVFSIDARRGRFAAPSPPPRAPLARRLGSSREDSGTGGSHSITGCYTAALEIEDDLAKTATIGPYDVIRHFGVALHQCSAVRGFDSQLALAIPYSRPRHHYDPESNALAPLLDARLYIHAVTR
jgi:hypothetical protein